MKIFMKKTLVLLLVLAAVALYYFKTMGPSSAIITLSVQNNSGESGTALLEEIDGKVRVTISVTGQPAGSKQPAHIHRGACPTPGAVTNPLTDVQNGTSVTMLDASLADLKALLPLAINLHKSATEASAYVACGDVAL